ncbi:CBS domain-containing protein [Halomarina ordinaria]|uniref:CBS domain-containing protein n=1 Tax=Halomarina ordinaria TaxID=3033939 RepID=A0ABD5UBT3_9EURY|nr:CBS domain-containing protein [Halomarina sp. PSRA2]
MDDIFVAQLMSSPPYTVSADTLVADAASVMLDNGIGSVVVTDEAGHLVGILTSTDFVHIVAESRPKARTTVSRYMSTDVTTLTAQVPIREAADAMIERGVHHMPVVDDEDVVIGMLSTTDLTAYLSYVRTPSPA